jgi:hypothetical protein
MANPIYCPQCGTESLSEQKYCRNCGANLKVIGKAVALSDAIARSDGLPGKLKDLFSNIKIAHITDDVSRALDKMNKEIVRHAPEAKKCEPWWLQEQREKRRPERRRERHIVKGTISLFTGTALMIFLYSLSGALILKLPPDVVAKIPFELDPVVKVIWLIGLIPALAGLGRIIAGLTIKPGPAPRAELPEPSQPATTPEQVFRTPYQEPLNVAANNEAPMSVTERTTNILNHKFSERQTREVGQQ